MATTVPPAPPETFAMLPDQVPSVPYGRADAVPQAGVPALSAPPPVAIGYVSSGSMQVPAISQNPEVDRLISTYAANYEVPESLVRRVVKRESNFRPEARNGPYWGLMQILPATARSLGFSGKARDLLDAETNLKYAVKYLKGAYLVAGGDHDQAVRNYARGYYYDAKRKGLLELAGLKSRSRMDNTQVASANPDDLPLAQTPPALTTPSTTPNGPAANIASQWEIGFASATNGKSTGQPAKPPLTRADVEPFAPPAQATARSTAPAPVVAAVVTKPHPARASAGPSSGVSLVSAVAPDAPSSLRMGRAPDESPGFGTTGVISTPSLAISD